MSCYSCSELLYKIGVNSTIQGIIAVKKYDLLSLWAPGLQLRSPPEITLLSPQSRSTREYGSNPVVPLKPPFFLSDSFTCLTVRDRHDKRLRFFLWFFSTFCSTFSVVVFFFRFLVKIAVFYVSGK